MIINIICLINKIKLVKHISEIKKLRCLNSK